jgi:hypothetical protein
MQAKVERVERNKDGKKDGVDQMSEVGVTDFSPAFIDDPPCSSSAINNSFPTLTTTVTAPGVMEVDQRLVDRSRNGPIDREILRRNIIGKHLVLDRSASFRIRPPYPSEWYRHGLVG